MSDKYEYCMLCDEPTGRAGAGEDSIYVMDYGPLCESCYGSLVPTIEQQAKEIDTLKKQITDMRKFCRTLTGSLWPQNETTEALKLYERGVSDEKKY